MNNLKDIIKYVTPTYISVEESIQIMNSCIYFDIASILKYYAIYFALLFLFRKYKKSSDLSAAIVSTFTCWKCILLRTHIGIVSYYWYDLFLMIHNRDYPMIAHHLFTLYSLNTCPSNPDYEKIYTSLFLLKSGDLFLHQYKITDMLELTKTRNLHVYQIITSILTLILWTGLRLIIPFGVYPFNNKLYGTICLIFHMANILWYIKLCSLITRLYKKIVNYKSQTQILK